MLAFFALPAFGRPPSEVTGCGLEGFFRVLIDISVPWGLGAGLPLLSPAVQLFLSPRP